MARRVHKALILAFVVGSTLLFQTSCKNSKAVCPGAGQSSAADFNPFNSDGEPKSGRKKKTDNGLINKKQPKKLNKK